VEAQYVGVALVLDQWVKQSAVNQLRALEFHIGVQMVMKPSLRLQRMAQ
jgi:hypothetical protein